MAYAPTQKPMMIKSNSAAGSQTLRAPIMHRHRKTVSTGGGRAWSDAEEAYLIETREHKMPYKHIANQLKKTELACRLHYHQLSFGSKSRRHSQAPTHQSDRSSAPPPAQQSRAETPQRPLPSFSPPASPPETMDCSPSEASSQSHNKPILPKPVPTTTTTQQRPNHNDSSNNIETHSPLRLVTQDVDLVQSRRNIDIAKLDLIYDTHRLHFWSTIARAYGCNLSPATLEEAWCRAHCSSCGQSSTSKFPPTPRGSPPHRDRSHSPSASSLSSSNVLNGGAPFSAPVPLDSSSKGFTPINNNHSSSNSEPSSKLTAGAAAPRKNSSFSSSFAISSLLTEDREVIRSPIGRERERERKASSSSDLGNSTELSMKE